MRADGTRFWASGRMTPLYEGNQHIGFLKVLRDRTAARIESERVRESEETWRGTFERLVEGLLIGEVVRDGDGRAIDWRYLEVNPAWERMTGSTRQEAQGRTIREIIPGIEDEWIAEFADVVDTGQPLSFLREVGVWSRWY